VSQENCPFHLLKPSITADRMARIESDNTEVERVLLRLEKLVTNSGGWLHPDLLIRCQEGNLSIELHDGDPGEKILGIPSTSFLPVDEMEVSLKDGTFDFHVLRSDALSSVQHHLAETTFALYNLTCKATFHQKNCFDFFMSACPSIGDRLLRARRLREFPDDVPNLISQDLPDRDLENFVRQGFLRSRILSFKDETISGKQQVIVPVMDFMNHHWSGTDFRIGNYPDGRHVVRLDCRQPVEGSHECFASYSTMDALDTFIKYGFIDQFVPLVRSIPLELEIGDLGKIYVSGRIGTVNFKKVVKEAQALGIFFPAMEKKEEDEVTVSHLLIPIEVSPLALRRTLVLSIGLLVKAPLEESVARELLRNAEWTVLQKNLSFYDSLLDDINQAEQKQGPGRVLDKACELATVQKSKLEKYQRMSV
jgi:hypothetical protein